MWRACMPLASGKEQCHVSARGRRANLPEALALQRRTMTWLAKVRKLSFFSPSCSTLMVLATTSSESVWPRKRLGKSICPPCGGCGLGRATRELPVGVGRGERDTRTLPPTRLEPLTVGFHQRVRGLLHLLPSRHALPHRLGQGLQHAVPCAIH